MHAGNWTSDLSLSSRGIYPLGHHCLVETMYGVGIANFIEQTYYLRSDMIMFARITRRKPYCVRKSNRCQRLLLILNDRYFVVIRWKFNYFCCDVTILNNLLSSSEKFYEYFVTQGILIPKFSQCCDEKLYVFYEKS